MSQDGSVEAPLYTKMLQDESRATDLYMIVVDEGWRSWVLCSGMYEWAADGLLEILRASGKTWPR